MKKVFFILIIFSLFMMPAFGQEVSDDFSFQDLPQWAKDLRRWDIITFGIFPFCVFFTTVVTDSMRWYNENGFDFSESGRRYAPWPLKSAGAYERSTDEHFQNIFIAACAAATLAVVDIIIIKIRQSNERKRIQNRPTSTYTIERSPANPPPEIDTQDIETQDIENPDIENPNNTAGINENSSSGLE